VEARDRKVIIDYPGDISGTALDETQLKKWIAEVVKTVYSSAFHYYTNGEMNFEQIKIYSSENILKNIVLLNKKRTLSPKDFEIIDTHIKNKVLKYLGTKYPLTDST
jgi:Leu/Phe-tRNA-protein transferase